MKNRIAAAALAAVTGLSLVGCQSLSEKIEFGLGIKVNALTPAATATVNVTAVAAAFDKDGKVLAADIDVYQTPYKLSTEGALELNTTAKQTKDAGTLVVESKKELGEDYAMTTVAGLEWFEQAERLEEYFVGKTVAEIKGAVTADKLPAAISADTVAATSRISIKVTDYVAALEEAFALKQAQETKAGKGNDIKVGVAGKVVSKSTGFDIIFGGIALDSNDTVVAINTDVVQVALVVSEGLIGFNTTNKGYATTPVNGDAWKSKRNLGDAYGMKSSSALGLEWYTQANTLQAHMIGKTAAQVSGFAFDATTFKVTDAQLLTKVSIKVNDYIAAWTKAIAAAE